jgi:hypothetical protein
VDWPYIPILARDGTFTPASSSTTKCAVLDRLPHFQYRIKLDAPFALSGITTVQKPGVCHMGRAAAASASSIKNCWKVNETDTSLTLQCEGSSNNITRTLMKRTIKTPHQMIKDNMYKRQTCESHCDAPPEFFYENTKMPVPEVGYGRPFRWEMARMIAGDLRFLLCGNATECPNLQASEWTLTNFLQNYFRSPHKLLNNTSSTATTTTTTLEDILDERDANPPPYSDEVAEFERMMWEDIPWVVCDKTVSNCSGTIPKAAWHKNRGETCRSEVVNFLAANPSSLAVELDLCNLNAQMDFLCRKILENVQKIANTNCISAGNDICLPKSFFYTPSTFSSSNQQVNVHATKSSLIHTHTQFLGSTFSGFLYTLSGFTMSPYTHTCAIFRLHIFRLPIHTFSSSTRSSLLYTLSGSTKSPYTHTKTPGSTYALVYISTETKI